MSNIVITSEEVKEDLRSAGLSLLEDGFSVVPVKKDKLPVCSWADLQRNQFTPDEFTDQLNKDQATGIAVIAGEVSDNLEFLDIDCKYDLTERLFLDLSEEINKYLPYLYEKFLIQKTVNGGYHFIYYAAEIEGNQKLAQRPTTEEERKKNPKEKFKVLLETRGEGGYALIHPSPGYQIRQGSFETIPTLTTDERETLLTICRSFDQTPVENLKKHLNPGQLNGRTSAYEEFNKSVTGLDLLLEAGWKVVGRRGDKILLLRPGQTTTPYSGYFYSESNLFYCFSTSTEFKAEETHNPVRVYAALYTNYDYNEAVKQIAAKGYGNSSPSVSSVSSRFPTEETVMSDYNQPSEAVNADFDTNKDLRFPVSVFPTPYRNIIDEVVQRMRLPEQYLAACLVTVASSVIGNLARVKIKEGWEEPVSLYMILLGESAIGKSPVIKFAMKPIFTFEEEFQEEHKSKMNQWEMEASQLPKGVKPPAPPVPKEIVIQNATTEAVTNVLANNSRGIISEQDEASGWVNGMNQYRQGNDQEFWMRVADGMSAKVSRVTKGRNLYIKNPFVSVLGGTTPVKIADLAKENRDTDGFIFRLLFAYIPNRKAQEWTDKGLDPQTKIIYESLLRSILRIQEEYPEIKTTVIPMSQEAQDKWVVYYNKNVKCINATKNNYERSIRSKMNAYCARFSLILEIMRVNQNNTDGSVGTLPSSVSLESLEGAIQITEYFTTNALRVFSTLIDNIPDKAFLAADLLKVRKSYAAIAKQLDVSKGTISKWKQKYPSIFR